jgi:hypothetical protein
MIEAAFGKSPVHILFGFNMRQIPTGNRLSDFTGLNEGGGDKIGNLVGMIFK